MIKRDIYSSLQKHLDKKEISLIAGPRQAGKTTLMKQLKQEIEHRGGKTVYLSLDFEADREYFFSQQILLDKLRLELGNKKAVVFIDEIQRKENAGLFLKGIFDMDLPYKLIVSGSGSVELKEKIHESLAGRKRIFELSTLSFWEFINYKTQYKYQDKLSLFFKINKHQVLSYFHEYLRFGGYPRVVIEETIEDKYEIINDILQSYLEKDIRYFGVEKTEAFLQLLKIIAYQIGQLTNYSELSSTLKISQKTVEKYLWYAQKTYIIEKVSPFFRNVRKEITKSPLYYFNDLGFCNYILGRFVESNFNENNGFLFQNFIFLFLKQLVPKSQINFWRTKDAAEVDFILNIGNKPVPLEAKYKTLDKPQISRSLINYINKYSPKKAYIINLNFREKRIINNTEVIFMPYYDLYNIDMIS